MTTVQRILVRKKRLVMRAAWTVAAALMMADGALAQQRPLLTEDPETIGAGRILLECGATAEHEAVYPLSGLTGNRLVVPSLGFSIGLSSIAEAAGRRQPVSAVDDHRSSAGAACQAARTCDGDRTTDVEDIVVATKIRLVTEGRWSARNRAAVRDAAAQCQQRIGTRNRCDGLLRVAPDRQDGSVDPRRRKRRAWRSLAIRRPECPSRTT